MPNISEVIGWRFNNQPGMTTRDGEIIAFPANVPGVNYDNSGLPTQAHQDTWTAEYEAHVADTQHLKDRETAISRLLPEPMCMLAMLDQAKSDKIAGKTLHPNLDEVVAIYHQILRDNPGLP